MAKPRTRLAIAPQVFAIFSQPTKREENLYEGFERSGHLRYLHFRFTPESGHCVLPRSSAEGQTGTGNLGRGCVNQFTRYSLL
jgi:hypothetical protein